MCIGILGVSTIDAMVDGGRQDEEEMLDGLVDTGRVCLAEGMEVGMGVGRAITTVAKAALAIGFIAQFQWE